MIKTFVILSAPSTASSLLAESLSNKIYMGKDSGNGHFENPYMLKLSQDILAYAREVDKEEPLIAGYKPRRESDPWDNPPSEQAVLASKRHFKNRIIRTIEQEAQKAVYSEPIKNEAGYAGTPAKFWGWKDGRVALIIPAIAEYLPNPHYIYLNRPINITAEAIVKRQGIAGYPISIAEATVLVKEYHRRIIKFLNESNK